MKTNKFRLGVIGVILVVFLFANSIINDNNLSEEQYLIEEINFSSDSSKNISDLYIYEKYKPDIYFCLGITNSNELYIGYKQIRKAGITTNGSESLYLTNTSIFNNPYFCFEKTEEEGKFYFGFINNKNVESVNINGQNVSVEYFNYPNNNEESFGFWHIKTDWNFSIKDFCYIESK